MKSTTVLLFITIIGILISIIGVLFKLQHYPFQNEMLTSGLLLTIGAWMYTMRLISKTNLPEGNKYQWYVLMVLFPVPVCLAAQYKLARSN